MEIKELKTEKMSVGGDTENMPLTETESEKPKRNLWREGLPGWVWSAMITIYALTERTLGGFGYKRFYDLATSGNNWLPELLMISLTGTLGYKSFKMYHNRMERKDEQQSSSTVEGS